MFIPAEIEFNRLLTAYQRRYGGDLPIERASLDEAIGILRRQLEAAEREPPPVARH